MFPHFLASVTAVLPSALKYKLKRLKPSYTRLMGLAGSNVRIQTVAGALNWKIDELTSQRFILGTYEPYMQEAFRKFICPGFTVYDIGAHAGFHSLFCGLLVGISGRVIAFEPNPVSSDSIRRQMKANSKLRVELCRMALSDQCGTAMLDISRGSSQETLSESGSLKVEVETIDSIVADGIAPPPDLIKLDVEGHEEAVVIGGMTVISKYKPIILCDTNDETTLPSMKNLLLPLGYELSNGPPITATPARVVTI
jgi:FkbM family methyltransferase